MQLKICACMPSQMYWLTLCYAPNHVRMHPCLMNVQLLQVGYPKSDMVIETHKEEELN